jgi:hypothetical protein
MAEYATAAEFESFEEDGTQDWTTDDPVALEKLLATAQRDVDGYLRHWGAPEANGFVFGSPKTTNPKRLTAAQVDSLMRITCARAEYRLAMGPEFFRHDQRKGSSGPDFSTQGTLDRVGPRVREELARSSMALRFGRAVV